ncbi:MAG: hypothetical protein JNL09_03055 [Anaerolineales bacterium]|nr:hypothetical protein [Anaerolineales bacterium]
MPKAKANSVKPRRIKESAPVYVVSTKAPKRARVQTAELQFFITLPDKTHAEAFTDQLIELVESYGGSVAGGTATEGE